VRIHVGAPLKCGARISECGVKSLKDDRSSNLIPHSALATPHLAASVPQQLQGEFRKLVFVGASPTRGSISKRRVGSADGGVKEVTECWLVLIPHFAVQTPHFNQGRDVTVSISACDADCAGANPVALTIFRSVHRRFTE
jgi:hypothetical protein